MSAIATIIRPRERDLGGFSVRRVLPAGPRQMVGPFIFFDALGPAMFAPGTGVDVRPHPHIGLATVTWLFEGELLHRDSLGFTQLIRPGEVSDWWIMASYNRRRTSASGSLSTIAFKWLPNCFAVGWVLTAHAAEARTSGSASVPATSSRKGTASAEDFESASTAATRSSPLAVGDERKLRKTGATRSKS